MGTEESLTVRHNSPRPVGSQVMVNRANDPPGMTVSELVMQTAELQKLAGDLGKVTYRLCVDGQGRVCNQSGSSVQFVVDYVAKKPAEEAPAAQPCYVEEAPVA